MEEIRNNHLGHKKPVNNGINYRSLNRWVSRISEPSTGSQILRGSDFYCSAKTLHLFGRTKRLEFVTYLRLSQNKMFPSKIEWDLTNGPRSVSCDQAIRYSGFFGVRKQWGLLEISWNVEYLNYVWQMLISIWRKRTSIEKSGVLQITYCQQHFVKKRTST